MSDPTPASAPAVSPAPAAPEVKSGWKTTELYVAMLGLGALIWVLHAIVGILPTIIANPAIPPWAVPVVGLIPVGIGWLVKRIVVEYVSLRTQLKLGPDTDISNAQDAGAAAASGNTLAQLNK